MIFDSQPFVGRHEQLDELRKILRSNKPEFIAVYGRRRVGKTFLVKEAAENNFAFYFTASHQVSKTEQLTNFILQLRKYSGDESLEVPKSWFTAFSMLSKYLDSLPKELNKVLFFDELPWADTPKSGFLGAFENFWNMRCAGNSDIKLIACGSATSWIINKIIHNRGGLHNRLTHQFIVKPFNLKESKEYFQTYGFSLSDEKIAETYMILGGIPYYFSLLDRGESIARNIDRLFFASNAILKNEFEKLYSALFRDPHMHLEVIRALSKKDAGLTRQELLKKLKITGNGSFTTILKELEECGFIRSYLPFKTKSKFEKAPVKTLYQLIDLYTLFYLKFIENNEYYDSDFWTSNYRDPKLNTWRGLAFEKLCLWHVPQIKEVLGIGGVSARICSWTGGIEDEGKAQIDLLIDRKDDVVNICEMKYSSGEYSISKKYAGELEKKIEIFVNATKTKKTPVLTFITNSGLKENSYNYMAQKSLTVVQLFR